MILITIQGDGFTGRYSLTSRTARLAEQNAGVIAFSGFEGTPDETRDAFIEFVNQGIRQAAPVRKPMAAERGWVAEVRSA